MRVVRPNCRNHFTGADFDFITSVLAPRRRQAGFLNELLTDLSTRDLILDSERLLSAVQDCPECLDISAYLYFYLLVRYGLMRAGIQDREVADYVAELLAEFSETGRLTQPLGNNLLSTEYIVDLLAALESLNDEGRFQVRIHIGNYALLMSGLYPQRILEKTRRSGSPGLGYYESVGRVNFGAASRLHLAGEFDLSTILDTLAAYFRIVRNALNEIAERFLFIRLPVFQERMLLPRGTLHGRR